MKPVLEVCTHSVESAVSAERGGAMRLELCANLMIGGTSPDEDLFRMVRERVSVPVRVLLRPRAGDFLYDEDEFELLCCQAARFAGLGADGIVIGLMKFCDPEEYDVPIIMDACREANIPLLVVDIDQQAIGDEQIQTRVQAFLEGMQ